MAEFLGEVAKAVGFLTVFAAMAYGAKCIGSFL